MRYFFLFMPALAIVIALAPLARSRQQSFTQNDGRATSLQRQRRYAEYYQLRARYERLRYGHYAMAKRQGKNK